MSYPPSPTLISVDPDNNSGLIATWLNSPYYDINNAYLLYVNKTESTINTNNNTMQYFYLTDEQAYDGTITIPNLIPGDTYLVQYVQTQLTPDGMQGGSNTKSAIPVQVEPVALAKVVLVYPTQTSAELQVTYNSGCEVAESLYIQIADETTGQFVVPAFIEYFNGYGYPPVAGETRSYIINDLVANHEYTASAFLITLQGMSPISNSVTWEQNAVPLIPVIGVAVSGQPGVATVSQFTLIQTFDQVTHIYFQVKSTVAGSSWVTVLDLSGNDIPATAPGSTITLNNVELPGLTNGLGYEIISYAKNDNGNGPTSNIVKAVPADIPSVSVSSFTYNAVAPEAALTLTATFTPSGISLPNNLTYNYIFKDPNGNMLTSGTSTVANTNPVSVQCIVSAGTVDWNNSYSVEVTLGEQVPATLLSYWDTPALDANDNILIQSLTPPALPSASRSVIPNSLPGPVTNIQSTPGDGSLYFTWTAPANPSFWGNDISYNVVLYEGAYGSTGPTEVEIETAYNQTYISFAGLTNNQRYYITVTPIGSEGPGAITSYPNSSASNAQIYPLAPLAVPTIQSILQTGSDGSNIFAILTFNQVDASNNNPDYSNYSYTLTYSPSSPPVQCTYNNDNKTYNLEFAYNANLSYNFELKVDASYTQPTLAVPASQTSTPQYPFNTSLAPVVSNVVFTPGTSNTTVTFTVNNNGSPLLTGDSEQPGLVLFALPSLTTPPPAGTIPVTYIQPAAGGGGTGTSNYNIILEYVVEVDPDSTAQYKTPFLLVASNSTGSGNANGALTYNPPN